VKKDFAVNVFPLVNIVLEQQVHVILALMGTTKILQLLALSVLITVRLVLMILNVLLVKLGLI
jgi:hypothetical protein